jgi:photosystem II stability/assembly factor-like uncharacterized protein
MSPAFSSLLGREHSHDMRAIAGRPHQQPSRSRRKSFRDALRFLIVFALIPLASAAPPLPNAARGLLLDAALNGHVIIAVGERGAIVRSVDSGETWESLASPTDATLTGIAFANPDHGWAVGHDGVILHTRDGGDTWTAQFHAEDRATVFLDVAAIDSARAIAIGAFGVCYITRDGGRSWLPHTLVSEDNHLNRVVQGEDSELFIAGERGTLLHLSGYNKPATPLPPPHEVSFYGLTPLSEEVLFAYGIHGHLYRSQNGGETWNRIDSPLPVLFSTALHLKSGTLIVAGQARSFLVSQDEGRTFRVWQPPLTTAVAELLEAPNGLILAFGEAGVTRLDPPENIRHATDENAPARTP